MKLFFVKYSWYDSYEDKDKEEAAFIFGKNFDDALHYLQDTYDYITKVEIESICDDCSPNILYLPDDYESYIKNIINVNSY